MISFQNTSINSLFTKTAPFVPSFCKNYILCLRTIRPSITDSHVRTVIKYDGDLDTSKNQSLFLGLPFPLPSHPSSLDVFLWRHTWHFLYLQISLFVENCLQYVTIHGFSVWLRTGYNPADINRFQSHTGNEKNMSLQWFNKYQREGGTVGYFIH